MFQLGSLFTLLFFAKCACFSVDTDTHLASRFQIPISLGTILYVLICAYVPTWGCSPPLLWWRRGRRRRRESFGSTNRYLRDASSLVGASATIWRMWIQSPPFAIGSSSHLHIPFTAPTVPSSVDFLARLRRSPFRRLVNSRHRFLYHDQEKNSAAQHDRPSESRRKVIQSQTAPCVSDVRAGSFTPLESTINP